MNNTKGESVLRVTRRALQVEKEYYERQSRQFGNAMTSVGITSLC